MFFHITMTLHTFCQLFARSLRVEVTCDDHLNSVEYHIISAKSVDRCHTRSVYYLISTIIARMQITPTINFDCAFTCLYQSQSIQCICNELHFHNTMVGWGRDVHLEMSIMNPLNNSEDSIRAIIQIDPMLQTLEEDQRATQNVCKPIVPSHWCPVYPNSDWQLWRTQQRISSSIELLAVLTALL